MTQREVQTQIPRSPGARDPRFAPNARIDRARPRMQAEPTQFDQLREVLLGAGSQAARAFAAEGTRNSQMEALRERARANSDRRLSQIAARFDQAHRSASAQAQSRQAAGQQKRVREIADKQMSLQLRAQERGPEWLFRQAASEFNNAATTEERQAWFPLLTRAQELVQQSELSEDRKMKADTLTEMSMAADTAKNTVDVLVSELQADDDLRRELIGDGTNIHSRVLEYVTGEAAMAAPDILNPGRDAPDFEEAEQLRMDLISQLERQAIRVGDALLGEYKQEADAAQSRVGMQKLKALRNAFIGGADAEQIRLTPDGNQPSQGSMTINGETVAAPDSGPTINGMSFDELAKERTKQDAGDESTALMDALREIQREHFNHMPQSQRDALKDEFVLTVSAQLGRLHDNISIADAVDKLEQLEQVFPEQRATIREAGHANLEQAIPDRLARNAFNALREAGITNVTPQNLQSAQQIINEVATNLEFNAGLPDGELTDQQTRLLRDVSDAENTITRELTQQAQRVAQQDQSIQLARDGREGGDYSALYEEGVMNKVLNGQTHLLSQNQQAILTHFLPPDFPLEAVESGEAFDPESPHHETFLTAALVAEAAEWNTNDSGFKEFPDRMVKTITTELASADAAVWSRYLTMTSALKQGQRSDLIKKIAKEGDQGQIIAAHLRAAGGNTMGQQDATANLEGRMSSLQADLTAGESRTTQAVLERSVLAESDSQVVRDRTDEVLTNQGAIQIALMDLLKYEATETREPYWFERAFAAMTPDALMRQGDPLGLRRSVSIDDMDLAEIDSRFKAMMTHAEPEMRAIYDIATRHILDGDEPAVAASKALTHFQAKGYDLVSSGDNKMRFTYTGVRKSPFGEFQHQPDKLRENVQTFTSLHRDTSTSVAQSIDRAIEVGGVDMRAVREQMGSINLPAGFNSVHEMTDEQILNSQQRVAKALLIQHHPHLSERIDLFDDEQSVDFEPWFSNQLWMDYMDGAVLTGEDGQEINVPPTVPMRVRFDGGVYHFTSPSNQAQSVFLWNHSAAGIDATPDPEPPVTARITDRPDQFRSQRSIIPPEQAADMQRGRPLEF